MPETGNKYTTQFDMESVNNNSHTLSIRFASDGLSLLVLDENQNTIATNAIEAKTEELDVETLKLELNSLFESKIEFAHTHYILDNPYYTVVPESATDESLRPALLAIQHHELIDKNLYYCTNQTQFQHVSVLFACPEAIVNAIDAHKNELKHRMTVFIDFVFNQNKSGIHLALREKEIDIVVFKQQLLLANSFCYESPADVIFHVANAASKLQLEIQETNKYVYSNAHYPELAALLTSKFSNIHFINQNSILCV